MEDQNVPRVDTIICDLHMPNIDGNQAITYLKRHHPHSPIVIMTGAPDFVLTEVLKNQGVADYLIKPVADKPLRCRSSDRSPSPASNEAKLALLSLPIFSSPHMTQCWCVW